VHTGERARSVPSSSRETASLSSSSSRMILPSPGRKLGGREGLALREPACYEAPRVVGALHEDPGRRFEEPTKPVARPLGEALQGNVGIDQPAGIDRGPRAD
jgi:hypothetical protein